MALAYTVRDRLLYTWYEALRPITEEVKVVVYLSQNF